LSSSPFTLATSDAWISAWDKPPLAASRLFRVAQRVAGVVSLSLTARRDVAGAEGVDRLADLAVEQVNLPDAFVRFAVAVVQVHCRWKTDPNRRGRTTARRNALGHRLENVKHGSGSSNATSHLRVIGVEGLTFLRSTGDEPYLAMKSIRARDADVVFRDVQNSGINVSFCTAAWMPARNSSSDRPALLEKFVHQRVVGLGDVLDQLAVQFLDLRSNSPVAGSSLYLPLASVA